MQLLRWLHRWLGVTVGLVMAAWCLSGFVMMYVSYPYHSDPARLRALPVLALNDCCVLPEETLPAETQLSGWSLRMLGATPVLRVVPNLLRAHGVLDAPAAFDLRTGVRLASLDADAAAVAAMDYGTALGIGQSPRFVATLDYDQWTVQGLHGRAPLHKFAFDDLPGTEIYVSSSSGEVLQVTRRAERFWNWLGAVPHWLYPTLLRANGALWTQVVIWASLIGTFLTVIGLWLGIVHWQKRRGGRLSPFRGLWQWHHIAGLFFGVLTLSWVVSGLLSMNPWGLLGGESGPAERRALIGDALDWSRWNANLAETLQRVHVHLPDAVEFRSAPLGGVPFIVAATAAGRRMRFDVNGEPAPLARGELARAFEALGPRSEELTLLAQGDDYHYRHKQNEAVPLPVWRAVLAGPEAVRVYVDPVSGALLRAVDRPQRSYRWWHAALHSLDFRAIRARPLWDVITLALMAGVSLVAVTGVWMSWRVLRR